MTADTDGRIVITNPGDFGRVAVMLGGRSAEREVSMHSGEAVLGALRQLHVDAERWDPAEHDFAEFLRAGFDRVWIALHGPGGEDGRLQGALEWAGVPYTGTGVLGSALAMDKVLSKQLLAAAGLPVPRAEVVASRSALDAILPSLSMPVMVKPAAQGSSLGMARVDTADALPVAWRNAHAYNERVLVEEWMTGDEYTVALLQDEALPSIRIEIDGGFYDYDAKYVSDRTRFVCPGTVVGDPLAEELTRLARASFEALHGRGWGRVDFMLDSDGRPRVLEVNTVPGMTSHSLVPCAAQAAGIDFPTLCWRILETSFGSVPNDEGARRG